MKNNNGNIVFTILGWAIGGFLVLIGVVSLFVFADEKSGRLGNFFISISMMLSGTILIPPLLKKLRTKVGLLNKFYMPPLVSFLIFITLSAIGASNLPSEENGKQPDNNKSTQQKADNSTTNKKYGKLLIPRSMEGDKGKYYLMEISKNGDIIQSLHERIGPDSTGYTKTESNCKTKLMRELGYSEESVDKIQNTPTTKWYELVPGSSKSDLYNFVCNQPIDKIEKALKESNIDVPKSSDSNEKQNEIPEWKKVAWIKEGEKAIKSKLKNPDSAKFRNETFHQFNGTPVACGEVNAENGFGGKNGFQRFIAAGSVITVLEEEMESPHEMDNAWSKICR